MSFLVGGAIGPAVSGFLNDATGSYAASLMAAAAALCAASAVACQLRHIAPWTLDTGVPDGHASPAR